MHPKAIRAFEDLSSGQDITAETSERFPEGYSTFGSCEPFQDISPSQVGLLPEPSQQVGEIPNYTSATPPQTSTSLNDTSSTAEAVTPAPREDSELPAKELVVPLENGNSLFGEGSHLGEDDSLFGDDPDGHDDNKIKSEVEGKRPPSIQIEHPTIRGDIQSDQSQVIDQDEQPHLGEGALNESASTKFASSYDPSQGFDPTFDANAFDLDPNQEVLDSEDMMALFPGLFSPKNQSLFDG
ncbi:uncharacterized protein MYCFIDRAFT_199115 [Pseudocercospora fijiensis CIRAD86]|uniref:Uncharacterized protein n=1 Tax=Pseudocercospora fijiensis (strain CIRAD86) TaxID=383855 RepID=M3AQF9_PSEFD|nr:uncharacterized protein MYCFIDRAFT_199115 [Pseudocercospora fijiensis CIRAD86]EME79318.1 hypothetical protein MYCFIDRAFT_199115 [Pseudocercospora fijiensis CIRAD86]